MLKGYDAKHCRTLGDWHHGHWWMITFDGIPSKTGVDIIYIYLEPK